MREKIKAALEAALKDTNFVIVESCKDDLEPTARVFYDSETKGIEISVGTPPGNAYRPQIGEYFIGLGIIATDSLEWNIKGDGDTDIAEDDKWSSEEDFIEEVNAQHREESISDWVSAIESEIEGEY